MASGRHEPYHDREFEEQDSDFDIVGRGFTDSRAEYERPRKRGTLDVVRIREMEAVNSGYQSGQRGENGRTRKGDYVQERRVLDGGRVREGEAVNGGYPSNYSERNSIRRKGRESAELSIESGDVLGRGITDLSDEYRTNRKVYERGVQDGIRVGGREAVNDGYHLGSSGTRKGRELGKPLTEHGDLKSPGTQSESPKLENGNKLLVESKKRKFTPIVWDRDDKEVSTSSKIRASPSIGLPPPPPRPKIYHKSPNIVSDGCVQISSVKDNNDDSQSSKPYLDKLLVAVEVETHISPLSDWPLDVASPSQKEKGDNYPEKELVDNQDNFTSVNILSSRWAGDADSPPDEGEIADDGDIGTSRKVSITRLAETSKHNKSLTPEYQDLKRERLERNMRRLSGSDDEGGYYRSTSIDVYSSDNMEKNEDEHGKNEDSATLSPTDSDDESVKKCMPESEPAAQRSIGMLEGCRSVDEYERLNRINEGAYGVVYRAKHKKTGDIVALKKVKMEKEREGFPLTALREINILLSFHHPSIVDVKEVVMGNNLDNIFMVMEYMEHDVKALMEAMKQPFSQSEVKCLMLQLLGGVKYLHDNWVLHRDLKTSNLLMNNRGELKICDFGLARQYGSPLKPYTHLVVTLWYRAPELLMGQKEYSTAIDMWSVGCIMAELLSKEPLFKGEKELDQLDKIFKMLGTPNETIWPGFSKLPGVKVNFVKHQCNQLRKKFRATTFTGSPVLSDSGLDLLNKLLTYDPDKRITADDALNHEWFREVPLPKTKEFMPTFPAQNAQDRRFRRVKKSPDPLEEQFRKELKKGGLGTGGLFE